MLSPLFDATSFHFKQPIHILGGGSIGLLWASLIRGLFPSFPVQVLLRDHHRHRIHDGNIAICLHELLPSSNKRRSRVIQVPAGLVSSSSSVSIRNLIVSTKAYQAVDAVNSIRQRIHSGETKLILLCNGALAVRQSLCNQQHPSQQSHSFSTFSSVHIALTTHGAYVERNDDDELFHIVHAGRGQTMIEEYPEMSQLWHLAGLNCQSISKGETEKQLWFKLAANAVINPITALMHCKNGELLSSRWENETFDFWMRHILQEVILVAQATSAITLDKMKLEDYVNKVIVDTSANKSSMLQDIEAARETEIDFLNGYIVDTGHRFGIECKVNQRLVQSIKEASGR